MRIALIAHDAKKKLMQNFCIAYRGILSRHQLFATGTTGRLIEEVTNLSVHKHLAGHLGGMQQIGAQIEQNEIDLLIFLRDPLNLMFGLGFPVVLLLLLSALQANIPVSLFEINTLTPGITVFGLSFMTLFSATLIARDRESAFLQKTGS